jgi:hypothetical protein
MIIIMIMFGIDSGRWQGGGTVTVAVRSTTRRPRPRKPGPGTRSNWREGGGGGGGGGGREEPEDEEGQSLAMTKRMGNPEEASVEGARGAAPRDVIYLERQNQWF